MFKIGDLVKIRRDLDECDEYFNGDIPEDITDDEISEYSWVFDNEEIEELGKLGNGRIVQINKGFTGSYHIKFDENKVLALPLDILIKATRMRLVK